MTVTQTNLAELYVSFFNRAPDSAGLAYWVDQLDKGVLSLEDISKNWMSEQAEGLAKYPVASTHTDFITLIYQAALGRAPDAEGLAYWQDQLTNNSVGRDVFLAAVINGAKANSSAQGVLDAATLNNKATAGVAFADKGLNDLTLAGQVVASVSSNPDTLAAAQAVIKLVPATAAGVTLALITLLSKTFDSIINLNAKAPGELGDLVTYLTAVANQASATTDLSALLNSVSTTVTKAATDSAALDNPASLAGEAVAAATPSTGGGGTPVTPTVTVIESKVGADEINVTAHPSKVVVQFGQDKQALADAAQATADQTDAAALQITATELQATADQTDAVALQTTATELQVTADQTDAVALQITATELQATADQTDAAALQTTATELQATADQTDAAALQITATELQATADQTDAAALQITATELQATADQTDAVALQMTASGLQTIAMLTDAVALQSAAETAVIQRDAYIAAYNFSLVADLNPDNGGDVVDNLIEIQQAFLTTPGVLPSDINLVNEALTDADAIALIAGFVDSYAAAAATAQAAASNAVADDQAAAAAQVAASNAVADDQAAAAAQTAADNAVADDQAAAAAQIAANNAVADDQAAASAQTAANNAMADDQAAATAQAAANNAVADDQAAATAQTAANNAVADDQAAATAQTAANNAVADDQAAATAQAAATSDADSHSTLAGMDIFTGFTIGTDKIDLLSVSGGAVAQPTGLVRLANVTESDDLTSALTAAFSGTAANKAALVVIEGGTAKGTYLYVNDADTALSATADVFIQLVGVTPGAVGQLAVGDYFA